MSDITQKMAEEMYQGMCDYVGANHEQECVKYIKFTLDSMESKIESSEKQLKAQQEVIDRLKDADKSYSDLEKEIEQLQKDSKAQQEVIDKLVEALKRIAKGYVGGVPLTEQRAILQKIAKEALNSIGVDK